MTKRIARVVGVVGVLAAGSAWAQADAGGTTPTSPFPAPHYQWFRNDIGFGFANIPSQEAYGGNVSVEPKFNVLDNLAVGARVEAMISGGGSIGGPDNDNVSVKQHVAVATLLKTDYFLTRSAVRPWVGLGIGRYAIVGQDVGTSSDVEVRQNAGAYFGVAPQLGLELGGFRLSATYNHIIGAQVEVRQSVGGDTQTKKYSQDYVTFEIGFRVGGRRR